MKLHLALRTTIHSTPPQHHVLVHGGTLLHYTSPYVYVTDVATHRIMHKLRYEDVQVMRVHRDRVYICTSDIYVLEMEKYEIVEVIRLSKALINRMEFDDAADERFVISKVDRRISVFEGLRKVGELASTSFCDRLLISGPLCGYLDKDRLVVHSGGAAVVDGAIESIACAFLASGGVYTIDESGTLKEWISGREVRLDAEIEHAGFFDGRIHISSGYDICEYELDGTLVGRTNMRDRIAEYSEGLDESLGGGDQDDSEDVKRAKLSQAASDDEDSGSGSTADSEAAIGYFDGSVVQVSHTSFAIHSGYKIEKMICFNDDVTDSVRYENFLLISTTAGDIAYTCVDGYGDGEYLFDGRVVECHDDSITSMAQFQDYILTGSRDRTVALWKIGVVDGTLLSFQRLRTLESFVEPVSAVALGFGLLAAATLDNVLQIYRIGDGAGDGLETVLVQQVHTKEISHISITPAHVITSSADKTARIFSHAGDEITSLSSDKVLHTSYSTEYIALCSHKMIRIYDHSFSQVTTFQVKKPVLSSCFYGGLFVGISDVLRIYDIERSKCVKSYDFEVAGCWSLAFPILCGENKIVFLEDESERVNAELLSDLRAGREESLLVEKYCRESRFREALGVVIKRNDYKKMFRIVCDGFYGSKSLDFLDAFTGCSSKLLEMLVQNSGFKQSEIFSLIVEKLVCGTADPVRKDKLYAICRRHSESIEKMYMNLLCLDIYDQQ